MAKNSGLGFIAYLIGTIIAALIINLWLSHKGIENGLKILITIVSSIFALCAYLVKVAFEFSAKEKRDMEDKIKDKAEKSQVDSLICKMDTFTISLQQNSKLVERVLDRIEELHATFDNMLLNKKKQK